MKRATPILILLLAACTEEPPPPALSPAEGPEPASTTVILKITGMMRGESGAV